MFYEITFYEKKTINTSLAAKDMELKIFCWETPSEANAKLIGNEVRDNFWRLKMTLNSRIRIK